MPSPLWAILAYVVRRSVSPSNSNLLAELHQLRLQLESTNAELQRHHNEQTATRVSLGLTMFGLGLAFVEFPRSGLLMSVEGLAFVILATCIIGWAVITGIR